MTLTIHNCLIAQFHRNNLRGGVLLGEADCLFNQTVSVYFYNLGCIILQAVRSISYIHRRTMENIAIDVVWRTSYHVGFKFCTRNISGSSNCDCGCGSQQKCLYQNLMNLLDELIYLRKTRKMIRFISDVEAGRCQDWVNTNWRTMGNYFLYGFRTKAIVWTNFYYILYCCYVIAQLVRYINVSIVIRISKKNWNLSELLFFTKMN